MMHPTEYLYIDFMFLQHLYLIKSLTLEMVLNIRVFADVFYRLTLYFLDRSTLSLYSLSQFLDSFFLPSLQLLLIQNIPDILGYAAQSTVTVHTTTIALIQLYPDSNEMWHWDVSISIKMVNLINVTTVLDIFLSFKALNEK